MKKINTLFIIIMLLMGAPLMLQAQEEEDDSRYLEGAVPEEQGKVVFSRDFSIPGMSKDEIMQRTEAWMDALMKQNKNNSRIVFTDAEAGNIVGNADHYLIFSRSALALDRTRMLFLLTATAKPESLKLEISRIHYLYYEGKKEENYLAEEMITDEYALNKARTKLSRGYAKWRRKTVDYVDSVFISAVNMLKATEADARNEQEVRNNNRQTAIVIANNQTAAAPAAQLPAAQPQPTEQAKPAVVETKPAEAKPAEAKPAETKPAAAAVPAAAPVPDGYTEADAEALSTDLIVAGSGRLVVAVGTDIYNMTTLTANAGGSLGKQNDKTVIYTIFGADQDAAALKKAETYSVRFYPNGAERPSIILECKALPSQPTVAGMPQIFSGEVQRVFLMKN